MTNKHKLDESHTVSWYTIRRKHGDVQTKPPQRQMTKAQKDLTIALSVNIKPAKSLAAAIRRQFY